MKNKYILLFCLIPFLLAAQPKWKKNITPKKHNLELFRGTMTPSLPTTETLKKGNWEYEISHRMGLLSSGFDGLYGLDGPVIMRTAVAYGISDNVMLNLGRSTIDDNLDLQLKYRFLQMRSKTMPSVLAFRGGIAWTPKPISRPELGIDRSRAAGRNYQFYAQLIYNVMFLKKTLGIGIVPSYLYNSYIYSVDAQYTFAVGNYIQYYINNLWSVWVEYTPVISGYQGPLNQSNSGETHNSVAFGFDMETGGHVFHITFTNNTRINSSQYLVGSTREFDFSKLTDIHFGFGITRHF